MPGWRRAVTAAAAVAAVTAFLTPRSTAAQLMRLLQPVTLRMTAYVGPLPDGVTSQYDWAVQLKAKTYDLHVITISVVSPPSVAPMDLDNAVSLYPVAFRLAGDPSALSAFESASPGQLMQINGYATMDEAARYLMLNSVTPAIAPAPPTPQPGDQTDSPPS